MMKKAISFLTSLALCLMPLAGTVSNTVAADDNAVISAENGENLSEMDIVFDDELIIAEGQTKEFSYTVTGTDKVIFEYNKSSNPGFTLENKFEDGKGVLTITSNWDSGKNNFVCWLGDDEDYVRKYFEFKVLFTCPDCGRVIENEDDIVHGPMRSVCKDCYDDHGFIAPPISGTGTTTTTTTTTTTDGVNIPVAPIFHATKPEYDRSVMQVGESREISFYNTETGEKRGIYMLSYDRSLFRVSGEYAEGTVTFTALKSGTAEITAYFKRDEVPDFREKVEISLSVADENGTIATTATTTTSVEDTYLLYDELHLVQVEDDVVIALDKNGIEFEKNGKYGFYKDSDRYFSGIRPGMRISCDFYYIVQITAVEWVGDTITVSEENCKVKPQALGDVNTDGVLNMADAVLIMQALANPDKYGIGLTAGISLRGEANGDVDQSGDVTNLDALMIQQYLLGIVTKFN